MDAGGRSGWFHEAPCGFMVVPWWFHSAIRCGTLPVVNGGYLYAEILSPRANGTTVLAHLVSVHTHSDSPTWQARLLAGEVTVDGVVAHATVTLQAGQRLCWHKPPWVEPDVPLDVVTVYDDDDLLAVHKPAGLPTLPGSGYLDHTLLSMVRALSSSMASPVHRLDRGTSGLVLFVKNADAARAMQVQWDAGGVDKVYRALVQGVVLDDETIVETPIGPMPDSIVGELFVASAAGKRSRSVLRVVERRAQTTLIDVALDTGRPHQIRIHAAVAGHALVGEPVYGAGGIRHHDSTARPGDIGYHLHAHTLQLRHPRSGARLVLVAPPPPLLTSLPASA